MHLFFISLFSLIMMAFPYYSKEKKELIPRQILFSNPDYHNPKLSPNGKKIAYLKPNDLHLLNVWIRPTDKEKKEELITLDSERGINDFFWQKDGEHILYLQDKDGNENWHLYQTNLHTKRTRDLTPYENVKIRLLHLSSTHPNQALITANLKNPAMHSAYRIDLNDGTLELAQENNGKITSFAVNDDLEIQAYLSYNEEGEYSLFAKNANESAFSEVLRFPLEDYNVALIGIDKSKNNLLFTGYLGGNTLKLIQLDLTTKKPKILFEHAEYDIGNVELHPTDLKPQGVSYHAKRLEWSFIDPVFQSHFSHLRQIPGDVYLESRDDNNKYWIVNYVKDNAPSEYYLYDTKEKKIRWLFSQKEKIKSYVFAKMEPISFVARDGLRIFGYLTIPVRSKKPPLVLYVHGGPWGRDVWGFSPTVQWLANRGYAVLQINYRGSCGYGKFFALAGRKEWANKMHMDLIDGKNWLIKQNLVDSNKVAIMGSSYGGYAALVGLSFTPDEFACGISHCGPSDLISLIKNIPSWHARRNFLHFFIGDPEKEEDFLKGRSPFFKVDQVKKPLLVIQGINDPIVPKEESEKIVQAMRSLRKPVEYLTFPDEGHKIGKPSNRFLYYWKTEAFLHQHLGGDLEKSISSNFN